MSFFSVHRIYREVWRAKCAIAKAYKLTHSTDKFRFCLDKSYGNEKRFSAAGQIKSYRKKLIANRTNCILMKAVVSNRTNRIVIHRLLVSCSNAPHIIICCLDKSDRIGIDTCYVFHCAAVASTDIFRTTVSIVHYRSIASKLSSQILFRAQNWNSSSENIR